MDECLLVAVALLQRRSDGGCGRAMLPCLVHRGRVNEAASTGFDEPRGDPSTPHVESTSIPVNPCQSASIRTHTPSAPLIGFSLACKPTAGSVRLSPPVSASIRQYPSVSTRIRSSLPDRWRRFDPRASLPPTLSTSCR